MGHPLRALLGFALIGLVSASACAEVAGVDTFHVCPGGVCEGDASAPPDASPERSADAAPDGACAALDTFKGVCWTCSTSRCHPQAVACSCDAICLDDVRCYVSSAVRCTNAQRSTTTIALTDCLRDLCKTECPGLR